MCYPAGYGKIIKVKFCGSLSLGKGAVRFILNRKEVTTVELELSQKQGLTLAMQTSMRLLQLNNLQLRSYLGEMMLSNAVVDLEYPEIDYRPSPFDRGYGARQSGAQADEPAIPKEQFIPDRASGESDLHDLFLQSAALNLAPPLQRILDYLIDSLDENGFLTESADTTAHTLGVSPEAVQKCIGLLQDMDPAGVGAADLADCLRLQLLRRDPQDPTALQIVAEHLTAMARQQYGSIAKALHVPKAQVLRSCELIRSLSPKPLNGQRGETPTQYIIPDFYIIEDNGLLRCVMNDYYLPKITVDPSYREMMRNKMLCPEDCEYLQKNYKQAAEVIKFLAYRKSTLQKVVEYVMQAQADFFRNGPGHRVALGNREIAQALSLHESTVSRAVSGKFFECKWGVFPLKSLFVHSTGGRQEGGSFDQILQRLQTLISAEPPGAAYSDQQLSAMLTAQGLPVARRTVAKYRQMLGIPTAGQRSHRAR